MGNVLECTRLTGLEGEARAEGGAPGEGHLAWPNEGGLASCGRWWQVQFWNLVAFPTLRGTCVFSSVRTPIVCLSLWVSEAECPPPFPRTAESALGKGDWPSSWGRGRQNLMVPLWHLCPCRLYHPPALCRMDCAQVPLPLPNYSMWHMTCLSWEPIEQSMKFAAGHSWLQSWLYCSLAVKRWTN